MVVRADVQRKMKKYKKIESGYYMTYSDYAKNHNISRQGARIRAKNNGNKLVKVGAYWLIKKK